MLIILLVYEIVFVQNDSSFNLVVLDVGQGDATLIKTPDKKFILIDTGGSNPKSLDELAKYFPLGTNLIDLVIVSHFDTDHIGSLPQLLNQYQVKNIAFNKQDPDYNLIWQSLFANRNTFSPYSSQITQIGCCVSIRWYRPLSSSVKEENSNSSSLAFSLEYDSKMFFFAGDSSFSEEDSLVDAIGDIDFLKVSHHGSKNSTSEYFLQKTRPEIAFISVGKNSYGHPNTEVVNNLGRAKVQTFRTDLGGSQIVIVNEDGLKHYQSGKCNYYCSYIMNFKESFE